MGLYEQQYGGSLHVEERMPTLAGVPIPGARPFRVWVEPAEVKRTRANRARERAAKAAARAIGRLPASRVTRQQQRRAAFLKAKALGGHTAARPWQSLVDWRGEL